MSHLDFAAFDADHHYYEAEDAFTRHLDKKMHKRTMQWAEINGRKRLLVGGAINRFIPNPTFDPVAKPGCLDEFFRGRNPEGKGIAELFGELYPISPSYRDRDARIAQLDEQGIDGCFLFPTLGVGMEEALKQDRPAAVAAFQSFNRWLDEDWGFNYKNRLYAAPYITLIDQDAAIADLEWALERGARLINLRSAPVPAAEGSLSPADPVFDPFWARVNEAGITVTFHSGDTGYLKVANMWGVEKEFHAFEFAPKRLCLSADPIHDLAAALICDGLFDRHPKLRIATIESGSSWVGVLAKQLKKTYGNLPFTYKRDPLETLREHFWVSPYYEDDLLGLKEIIGVESILFGSDFPHAEGLADPTSFANDLKGFNEEEIRQVMRSNGLALSQPA